MGPSNGLLCEDGSFSHHRNPHRFLQSEVLRLPFPTLEPWVAWSVSLPSCSSWFIHMQMWDHLLHQPQPRLSWSSRRHYAMSPLRPSCLSLPLLPVWMNVSSLTPWLLDFHTVWFSGSSGYFFFVFKLVVVLLLVVWGSKMYLPTPSSWPEVHFSSLSFFG